MTSLSEASYKVVDETWKSIDRVQQSPMFGWLSNQLPTYTPSTMLLKARAQQRSPGLRPLLELEPTDHPLAVEQRMGISYERIGQSYHVFAGQELSRDLQP